VTFVTASGDSGGKYGAQWPATSPNVVAVGGTTLQVDSLGNIISETAWSGSGGGRSTIVPEPQFQARVQLSGRRTTPDVALDADPSTGVPVYVVGPSFGMSYWLALGGTSLSAQLFAGVMAVADQGRSLMGAGTLDGPGQTLPYLYALPSTAYHDVIFGFNGHRAMRGYDLVTGFGSPVGPALVEDLARGVVVPVITNSARARATKLKHAVVRRATTVFALYPSAVDRHAAARLAIRNPSATKSRRNQSASEAHHAGPGTQGN
jgi:hypothetical protein